MGSASTTVTANWTVFRDANGSPTTVSGDDVTVYVNNSLPFFTGEAWSDIDLLTGIPSGVTLTDATFDLGVQVTGSRNNPSSAISPSITFIDKAQYLARSFSLGYGGFGAGGVGDLPDDNDPHHITYDNNVYQSITLGNGILDIDVFAAALSNAATPVVIQVLGPQNGATGTGLTYAAPLTITFFWDDVAAPTIQPPLRQYPREDGLGASSTRRVYPPPRSIQRSNRRGPSAIS